MLSPLANTDMQTSGITDIAHSIQLAVAPVFLLSAVAGTLAVLTSRLARIIDRARLLETALPEAPPSRATEAREELRVLSRRARLIHRAITMSTACALSICLVIVALFVGTALGRDLSRVIVVLFVVGLCAFIGAFVAFLFEIRSATSSLHFGKESKAN
jgi:predicted MFS family arabinose efflux permease